MKQLLKNKYNLFFNKILLLKLLRNNNFFIKIETFFINNTKNKYYGTH
jgi:hypothetical protein